MQPPESLKRVRRKRVGWKLLMGLAVVSAIAAFGGRYAQRHVPILRSYQPDTRVADPPEPLREIARSLGISADPIENARIEIAKADGELYVFAGETLLKTYPMTLGFGGLGDKMKRDDGCTPEGELRIVQKVVQAQPRRWGDVWLRLNYPTPEDARRGLAEGLIRQREYDAILDADRRRKTPPQNTRLGGGIGIHIGGLNPPGWTQGCIALRREDGIEISEQVQVGTPVTIRP